MIEVKNGFNPEALLEQLYKVTKMEDTFGINAVALVDGQPRTLNARSADRLSRAPLRRDPATDGLRSKSRCGPAPPGGGLLVAILDIDDVIAIIRSSDEVAHRHGSG